MRDRYSARARYDDSFELCGYTWYCGGTTGAQSHTGMKTMVSTAGNGLSGAMTSSDVLLRGAKAGPWVVERELGRGGMGTVYAVTHEEIGKRAALKIVHQRLLTPGFNSDRMLLEAKVVNQVGHTNIVDIFETGKLADGRPYIVMERLDGHALSARASECKLLPDLVISILLQVCDALIAAHAAGIVHRDLKLDNVFLVDNPEDPSTPKVKLLDWGIAKVLSHDVKHTVEGILVGTPQYLAPEQARGHAVSPKTDVYSLGVMAYELFLEQLPFEAETAAEVIAMHLRATPPPPCELWPDVPPALQDLLLAMLAKLPAQRPMVPEVIRRLEAVRAEFERRRQGGWPRCSTTTPIEGSSPGRRISAAFGAVIGISPPLAGTRRWQYALGALVLVTSALLFGISRAGGRAASAATAVNASAAPETALGSDLPVVGEPDRDATAIPDLEVSQRTALETPVSPRISAVPVAVHAERVPVSRSSALRTTLRPTPARKPPVAPHRGHKLDPDGTLDPYR